ncbi:hypothetical protein NLG97_g5910 [Lecanicillium saksenae]|uniref:Uncharacterized protein n=1 Tax=Lecanicillium saksenae TaxID=468837 RepID=A0ACC1QR46_9HYPO|nr:hypothetical protein NLG97_g5910 [Lecanicillium saksenae]
MSEEEEVRSTVALVAGALLPALATVFFNGIPGAIGGSNLPRWGVRLPILLTCAVQLWFTLVSRAVPEPYLDEIFHIPQAQKYCEGRFLDWDDKITTPPGLYEFLPIAFGYRDPSAHAYIPDTSSQSLPTESPRRFTSRSSAFATSSAFAPSTLSASLASATSHSGAGKAVPALAGVVGLMAALL